jgi:hypothetical protein
LISTGIGAAIVGVGLLVENWEKLTKVVKDFLGIETKDLKAVSELAQRQVELAEARGESEAKVQNLLMDAYDARIAAAEKEEERAQLIHEKEVARLTYRTKLQTDAVAKQKENTEKLKELDKDALKTSEELHLSKITNESERERELLTQKLDALKLEEEEERKAIIKQFTNEEQREEALLKLKEKYIDLNVLLSEESAKKQKDIKLRENDLILKYAQQSAESLFNFRSSEYDRLSKQAKTAAEDEILALDRQLKNNQITQEFYEQQKATITDKYAKESEKYERKKFENDKVAAIAQALISTYLAGAQVLAQTKGGTIARIIGMTATITAGLAQVATISRQQFRGGTSGKMSATESLSAGGGGSSPQPSEIFANPQMTMLGTDGAAMSQGQGSSPMRAYVVERDITQSTRRVRRLEEFATLGA